MLCTAPAHPYEPLTSENSSLILVDHQVGLMTGVRHYSIAELKHNVVGLAKAAKALKLPIVVKYLAGGPSRARKRKPEAAPVNPFQGAGS